MDLDRILNEALNEAMCFESQRIKNPNSNKITQFVMDFMDRKNLKNDSLHIVIKRDLLSKLLNEQSEIYAIGGIRWNGVHIEKIKHLFEKEGIKYEPPF